MRSSLPVRTVLAIVSTVVLHAGSGGVFVTGMSNKPIIYHQTHALLHMLKTYVAL